jgi:hypothetical protein
MNIPNEMKKRVLLNLLEEKQHRQSVIKESEAYKSGSSFSQSTLAKLDTQVLVLQDLTYNMQWPRQA